MTPDEAKQLVLQRYPQANLLHERGYVCVTTGGSVCRLSRWYLTDAAAWLDAAMSCVDGSVQKTLADQQETG